jgi:polysaccharide export outer membrane protein
MVRRLRLHEVLVTAGGITQNASGTIEILHTEPEMCSEPEDTLTATGPVAANQSKDFDIGRLETYKISDLKGGAVENNPVIRPGDIVIVNEGEPVFVTGAVFQPKELVIKEQLTLGRAIAMAGGTQKLAKTSEVHVYRKKEGKVGSEDLKFDYDAIKKGKEPDVLLQPYDIIDVRQVGALAPKSLLEILRGFGTSTLGVLPMRMPIP